MASQVTKTKAERINIRATDDEKRLIEEAASIMRMNTSQFIMQAAVRSAEDVLVERTRFVLPANKWNEFMTSLDRPAREIPALKKAMSKPSPFSDR